MTSVTLALAGRHPFPKPNRAHLCCILHEQLEDKQIRRNPQPSVQSISILFKTGWVGKEENQGKTAPGRVYANWEPEPSARGHRDLSCCMNSAVS
jgi:hypothetical protein